MTVNMFEQASRLKLRYKTNEGVHSTETLWDMELSTLDQAYQKLVKEVGNTENSLLQDHKVDPKTQLKIDIIRYIVTTRMQEIDKVRARNERKRKQQDLMRILADKERVELQNKSTEDLRKMIEELSD